jgi:hypothetical protein
VFLGKTFPYYFQIEMLIHTGSFQVTVESFSTWNVCLYYVWFPQFHAIRDRATDRPLVEVPSPA